MASYAGNPVMQSFVPPSAMVTNTLYAPQGPKPISLKTGFTIPISEHIATLQQQKLPSELETPEYLNEEELLEVLITDITESSSIQEACIRSRHDLLATLALWKISTAKLQVKLHCGDDREVFTHITTQSVEFNQEAANAFQGMVRKIHEINTLGAADSLFSQTACEMAISRLIHHYYLSENMGALKKAFTKIATVLGNSSRLSGQTTEVLRGLLYFSGLALSKLSSASIADSNELLTHDLLNLSTPSLVSSSSSSALQSSTNLAASSQSDGKPLSLFILQQLLLAHSIQWSAALLAPSIDDILQNSWLALAFDPKHLASMQEAEMIKLIAQVPWYHFSNMSSSTNSVIEISPTASLSLSQRRPPSIVPSDAEFINAVKNGILLPIQSAIAVAAGKNYVGALVLFAKVLALVSRSSPAQLTATCIGILMRAPWPAKMTSVPALQLFDWNALDGETLSLLFGELYHLHQRKPFEYATSTTRQTKIEHRDQFANYVVSNQPMIAITYQVDQNLAQLNFQRSYPIFFCLAHIALASIKILRRSNSLLASSESAQEENGLTFDLPRIIAEELFHFASAWVPVSNNPNYQYQRNVHPLFRAEAHDALQRICQEEPRLYSHIMLELLQNMSVPNYDLAVGTKQLQPQLMLIDENLVNSLAFLMCRRSFEVLPPSNAPTFRTAASAMAESIISDAGPERSTDHLAWPVATHIFSNLLWHSASPLLRCKAILLLLSLNNVKGAPVDAQEWVLTMLGRLLSPSFLDSLGPISIDLILNQLQSIPSENAAFITVRIIIALNAVKTAVSQNQLSSNNGSEISMNRFNFNWLWGSFKLKSLLDQLIPALNKLPKVQVNVATPKASLKPSNLHTVNGAADALNSLASSATNAIFGLQSTSKPKSVQSTTVIANPVGVRSTHQSLLLQRVAYHYAHCIKHSPGQLQREVSVLFGVLIDQLESWQKGSGIQVLEELFNESMRPSTSLSETELQMRPLWLNFWVYALVPLLPKWPTSNAIASLLDSFSYAAFFSQAKFGEMVSLLPTLQEKKQKVASEVQWLPNHQIVGMLLQRRHFWLAYLLLWAYGPQASPNCYRILPAEALQETPTAFQNTPLWQWFMAAADRHTPPDIALIYWERFFWTYFEVGAQMADFDFLPQRWKNMVQHVLLTYGSALANPGIKYNIPSPDHLVPEGAAPSGLNQLYARLATWNKSTIFLSGAYLFQPHLLPPDAPEAGLLAELQASAPIPPIFAIPYDANQFDAIAQKPFPLLPDPETPSVLLSLIPVPKADSSALFTHESKLNRSYLAELERNYKALTTNKPNATDDFDPRMTSETTFGSLPVLDDIEVWTVQLKDLESGMAECDNREFGMLRNLWKLVPNSVPIAASCGDHCAAPARSQYVVHEAVLTDPSSSDIIQRTRKEFQELYQSHVVALKSLATSTVILEDLCHVVLDTVSSERDSLCVHLFFEILPLLINQSIRDTSPLYSRLLKCVLLLGQEVIQSRPTRDHMRFFKLILEGTKRPAPAPSHTLIAKNSSPRLPLFELFTPTCFIPADGDYSVFVELLYIFVKTPHDLQEDEEVAIASQFNLVKTLPTMVDRHLDRLFEILELAALRSALIEFVKLAVTSILNKHATLPSPSPSGSIDLLGVMPENSVSNLTTSPNTEIIGKIVRLVLIACPHSPMLGSWEMVKDAWLGPYVLPFVISALPSSHGVVISSAIGLVSRVTSLPTFNIQSDFNLLAMFFKALFSNSTRTPLMNPKNRAAFMAGFELLVARCVPDAIWPIYLNVLTPFFAHNSGSDFTQALDILCAADWQGSLRTHLVDPNFVVQLAALPLFHLPMVRAIFSGIDWMDYASKAKSGEDTIPSPTVDLLGDSQQALPATTMPIPAKMVHFLQIFCKLNLLAPSSISPPLKKLVMSISKHPSIWYQDGKHLFDWRAANPEDFKAAFHGDTMVSAVRFLAQSQRTHDPAEDFKDNIQLLNDVCRHSGSVEAIEVCLEEIRSALFFYCPSTTKGGIWQLPIHVNIEFVSNYMIPLTQQYHQMQAERCTLPPKGNGAPRMIYHQSSYDALVSLLSVAHTLPSSHLSSSMSPLRTNTRTIERLAAAELTSARVQLIDVPIPFTSFLADGTMSTSGSFHREAAEASTVIRGLVVRFMGTLDSDLCLAVLHVASRAFSSNYLMLVGIWEEALRSYFIQSTFSEQLSISVNAISVPEVANLKDLLVPCGEMKCPLSMRILLEREKEGWINMSPHRFSERVVSVIPQVVDCIGPQHREFDLMVVWFFVLDCVAHSKFKVTQETASGIGQLIQFFNRNTGENQGFLLNTLSKLNSYFDESVHKEMLKITMRACRLMLQREVLGKEPLAAQFVPDCFPTDLEAQSAQLLKSFSSAKKGSEILRYAAFFQHILPNILTPLLDVASFEMQMVRTLVPIAPYLQCFIEGHDTWTQWSE
jgi:hypothetical protein